MVQIKDKCCVDLDDNQICDLEEISGTTLEENEINIITEEKPIEKPVITVESPITKTEIIEKTKKEPVNQITGQTTVEEPMIKVESSADISKPDTETYQFVELYDKTKPGYQYVYITEWHRVKGNKVKIELNIPKKFRSILIEGKEYPIFYVDRIYLDRSKQEVIGYCEKDPTCFSEELLDVPLKLDYTEFKEKTPDEWLYEYGSQQPDLFEERKYYIKNQLTTRATYTTETGEIRIYFDPKIGLPLRIEKQIGNYPMEITEFFELTAGTVRDIDVIHRTRDEIPPEEAFYSTRS